MSKSHLLFFKREFKQVISAFFEDEDVEPYYYKFYEPIAWKERKEPYGNNAELILTCGNFSSLFQYLNGYVEEGIQIQKTIQRITKKYNLYFELCTEWYGGFYNIPKEDLNEIKHNPLREM